MVSAGQHAAEPLHLSIGIDAVRNKGQDHSADSVQPDRCRVRLAVVVLSAGVASNSDAGRILSAACDSSARKRDFSLADLFMRAAFGGDGWRRGIACHACKRRGGTNGRDDRRHAATADGVDRLMCRAAAAEIAANPSAGSSDSKEHHAGHGSAWQFGAYLSCPDRHRESFDGADLRPSDYAFDRHGRSERALGRILHAGRRRIVGYSKAEARASAAIWRLRDCLLRCQGAAADPACGRGAPRNFDSDGMEEIT